MEERMKNMNESCLKTKVNIILARSFQNFELKNWRVVKTPLVPNLLSLWLRSPEFYFESIYAKQCLFVQTVAAGHVGCSTLRPGDGFKVCWDKEQNFQLKILVQIFCFWAQCNAMVIDIQKLKNHYLWTLRSDWSNKFWVTLNFLGNSTFIKYFVTVPPLALILHYSFVLLRTKVFRHFKGILFWP